MKIAAFGEVMMRLTVPDHLLLEQADQLQLSFTGTGVNILASLAHFGHETVLVSALPANRVGDAAAAGLRRLGMSNRFIVRRGDHIGSFFVELGYGNRAEQVTYLNRLASAFGTSTATDYDFAGVLTRLDALHICGISLSLSEGTREAAFAFADAAAADHVPVYFDFNYRLALNAANTHEQMKAYYERILKPSTVVFGSRRDLTDLMGYDRQQNDETLFSQFVRDHQLRAFAGTERSVRDGRTYIRGFLCTPTGLTWSAEQELTTLDRIGGGDAYAAGVIHGLNAGWAVDRVLAFAIANTALAHAQIGDSPLATAEQVEAFVRHGGGTGALIR